MPYKDYEKLKQYARNYYYLHKKKVLKNVKKYYLANWELKQKQRFDWLKANPEKVKISRKKYHQSEKGKLALKKAFKKYYSNRENHTKKLARYAVRNAVRKNELIKPKNCEECGITTKLEAHHYQGYMPENYLTIKWLCQKCHRKQHI